MSFLERTNTDFIKQAAKSCSMGGALEAKEVFPHILISRLDHSNSSISTDLVYRTPLPFLSMATLPIFCDSSIQVRAGSCHLLIKI